MRLCGDTWFRMRLEHLRVCAPTHAWLHLRMAHTGTYRCTACISDEMYAEVAQKQG
jgi:hypothetical protein